MVIAGFIEMLSVTLILPFIEVIMNSDEVMANRYVQMLCRAFGIESHRTFLTFLALVMAVVYVVKNIFLWDYPKVCVDDVMGRSPVLQPDIFS